MKKTRKLILIVHTSLDGYVADKEATFNSFSPSPENLDFVCSLTDEADAALVGRVSYQMLERYWPTARDNEHASKSEINYSNWYNEAQKIVLSKSMSNLDLKKTTIVSENVADKVREIKAQRGRNILMFGSPTAYQTLDSLDLIDEYWVIQYPVIFGNGIPFFTHARNLKRFKLLKTKLFSNGEIALNYVVERE